MVNVMDNMISKNTVINIIRTTISDFSDLTDDKFETAISGAKVGTDISDRDKLLISICKAITNNIGLLPPVIELKDASCTTSDYYSDAACDDLAVEDFDQLTSYITKIKNINQMRSVKKEQYEQILRKTSN